MSRERTICRWAIRRAAHFDSGVDSFHPGGVQFAFADGHVDFLSESIEQSTLEALTTRAGGEPVSDY